MGVTDTSTTEVAILMDDHVNKYRPRVQTFRLQSISGLQNNSRDVETTYVSVPHPIEVTKSYPKKFIPVSTRFIVSFNSGDITKPVIVGREGE